MESTHGLRRVAGPVEIFQGGRCVAIASEVALRRSTDGREHVESTKGVPPNVLREDDGVALHLVDGPPGGGGLSPSEFFVTLAVLEALDVPAGDARSGEIWERTAEEIARVASPRLDAEEAGELLEVLEIERLAERRKGGHFGHHPRWRLTESGIEALGWSGPPLPEGMSPIDYASEMGLAAATFYRCAIAEIYRGVTFGPAVTARARFCAALRERCGWPAEMIAVRFGMNPEWVEQSIARWARVKFARHAKGRA